MSIKERVEAYFDGELSSTEQEAFESDLQTNSELKSEFDFQNSVVEGIKEARKLELKAMLNNVPVGGSVGVSGTAINYITAIVITAFVGFGIYYFWPESETTSEEVKTEEQVVENNIPDTNEEAGNTQEPAEDLPVVEELSDDPIVEDTTPEPSEEEDTQEEKVNESLNTDIVKPSVIESFDTEEGSEAELPVNDLLDKTTYGEDPVDVAIDSEHRKFDFHYQFLNGRLVLYGDFNETYEILDFMQDTSRALYLVYQDKYYPLQTNKSDVQKLQQTVDPEVVRNLKKIRKSKAN